MSGPGRDRTVTTRNPTGARGVDGPEMTAHTRIPAIISVSVVALAGCGGGGHRSRGESTRGAATPVASPVGPRDTGNLACHESIDLRRPAATGMHVVLGVVALPTAPAYSALQTGRTGMHGRLRLFAKTGLVIKPHVRFALEVPAALRGRMAIAWGNAGDPPPQGRFVVNDCGRGARTGSKWLVYAGGYYVSRPGCMPLVVIAHGRRRRVRIGLGAPCPGQKPPPQPTQT
jgi:hypothetical protein